VKIEVSLSEAREKAGGAGGRRGEGTH